MYLTRCSLCDHVNPEDSRFCNGCGTSLFQARPPAANALPEPPAAAKAGIEPPAKPKPEPALHEPLHQPPHQPPHQPLPARRDSNRIGSTQRWLIACSPVAIVLAGLGYLAYTQLSVPDVAGLLPTMQAEAPAAEHRAGGFVPVRAAVAHVQPMPAPVPSASPAQGPAPVQPPARVVEPRAAPVDVPRAPPERVPADLGPCTAAVAALGLCTLITASARE